MHSTPPLNTNANKGLAIFRYFQSVFNFKILKLPKVFRHIVRNEGFGALYKGLIPNLVGVAPSKLVLSFLRISSSFERISVAEPSTFTPTRQVNDFGTTRPTFLCPIRQSFTWSRPELLVSYGTLRCFFRCLCSQSRRSVIHINLQVRKQVGCVFSDVNPIFC